MQKAVKALPVEQSYDYHRTLAAGAVHRLRRNPATRPRPGEMAVPVEGWHVRVHAEAGPLVGLGARVLCEYLGRSMQVRAAVQQTDSLADWSA